MKSVVDRQQTEALVVHPDHTNPSFQSLRSRVCVINSLSYWMEKEEMKTKIQRKWRKMQIRKISWKIEPTSL